MLGYSQQRATDLAVIESQFDLTSSYGVANGLSGFFNAFSQLAVNPNDNVSRQGVLDQAANVATSFNQTAIALQQVSTGIDSQTQDTVNGINRIADQIAGINKVYRANASASQDAGLDAQLNAALEELSGLANYSVVRTADGAANVFLGGQTILVLGTNPRLFRWMHRRRRPLFGIATGTTLQRSLQAANWELCWAKRTPRYPAI